LITPSEARANASCASVHGEKRDQVRYNKNETIINIMTHKYYKTDSKNGLVTLPRFYRSELGERCTFRAFAFTLRKHYEKWKLYAAN